MIDSILEIYFNSLFYVDWVRHEGVKSSVFLLQRSNVKLSSWQVINKLKMIHVYIGYKNTFFGHQIIQKFCFKMQVAQFMIVELQLTTVFYAYIGQKYNYCLVH